jgi:hypothetical protein
MWSATTGHCEKDVESLRKSKKYLLYGHYNTGAISQQTKIKSHKARLNLHSRKQVYKMNYFETYAPVLT